MAKPNKLARLEGWLPVFSGFGYSCWDPSPAISEHLREIGYPEGAPIWDYWNNAAYELEVVQLCVEQIQEWLPKQSGIVRITRLWSETCRSTP